MPKEKSSTTTKSSYSERGCRQVSRDPPADRVDRRIQKTDRHRRSPSPSESESTLLSDSSTADYTGQNFLSSIDTDSTSMAKTSETDKLARILATMLEQTNLDRRRDEERREREEDERRRESVEAKQRQDRWEEEQLRRDEKRDKDTKDMILALREAQPAVPQTVHIENTKLPKMKAGEDVEVFIDLFEAAMEDNNVPQAKWRAKLHAALDSETKIKIRDLMRDATATYQEVKDGLIGCSALTFSNASETLMSADRGKILALPIRQAIHKMHRILEKMSGEAETISEACMYVAVAIARYHSNPELKKYLDVRNDFAKDRFCRIVDEWQANQPQGSKWSRKPEHLGTSMDKPFSKTYRKPGACFHCGKPGHFSKDCRTRQAEERPPYTQQLPVVKQEPLPYSSSAPLTDSHTRVTSGPRPVRREVTCFNCQQKGHKSPQCPLKQVKCVQVPMTKPVLLKDNELMGSIGAHVLPVTCDSGADITIVPEECVQQSDFTGETCEVSSFNRVVSSGKICNVEVKLGDRTFKRKAVAQPGKDLGWTICLSLPYRKKDDREFVSALMDTKFQLDEEKRMYIPPVMEDGVIQATPMVCAGNTNIAAAHTSQDSVPLNNTDLDEVEECLEEGESETVETKGEVREEAAELGDGDDLLGVEENSLVSVEAAVGSLDGSAEIEGKQETLVLDGIHQLDSNGTLANETLTDPTLAHIRELARLEKEGYHQKKDIIYRTRLNIKGEPEDQICVPEKLRLKCMNMAHGKFGHQGRNKMIELMRPYFYWPTMSRDCMLHIRGCETCQKQDKAKMRPNPMQLRETSSIPFENLSVDLVGPFPTAVGGFKYLLTAIDLATRWPEAIPLRTTTAKVITKHLMTIFSRCGFPARLTTDNGPQFKGDFFRNWAKHLGIQHVFSSPYHPQGNGVVERLHRTLNAMVAKLTEVKGNWANTVPMALYFLRSTPCSATGMSPFMARQGWEPATPLDLLYKAWAEQDAGNLDIVDWIELNIERVESLREKSVATLAKSANARKEKWDKKAKPRSFKVGDKVLVRKPGMCTKLEESWDGPFTVIKVNSPVSYAVDFGYRKSPSIHIQLMKVFKSQDERVARVTSVLAPDTQSDDIRDRLASVEVEQQTKSSKQQKDIADIERTYLDILTKNPGCTDRVSFSIDTGDSAPLFQRAYNTPTVLREHIDNELDWLLDRGYIRPSSSPWASPMVAVRKQDGTARLCVDYRRLNSVTRQASFYMPRVEEVLEGVGQASFISKLDLTKGYYQIPVKESDIAKTCFICHRGRFEFTRMPFGVRNAPAVFQELMQSILHNTNGYAMAYMDDVIIYSTSWDEHLTHVRAVLDRLKQANLTINPSKCVWGGSSMTFLGHEVGAGKMSLPAHRVEALKGYKRPSTKRGLRAFLGSVSFYRRYAKQLAAQTAVLTPYTGKQAPSKIVWDEEGERAFNHIISIMAHTTSLCIPLPHDTFSLVTDASGLGIGGVLQVLRDGEWQAAAYYSRQLKGPEQRYSATEMEALAMLETINHFNYYLYGRSFRVYTDHKPLLQLLTSEHLNPRLRRFAYKLQHWLLEVCYLPGEENSLADALSREERDQDITEATGLSGASTPVSHLLAGDVEGQPPQEER